MLRTLIKDMDYIRVLDYILDRPVEIEVTTLSKDLFIGYEKLSEILHEFAFYGLLLESGTDMFKINFCNAIFIWLHNIDMKCSAKVIDKEIGFDKVKTMKAKINGMEIEGSAEEIEELLSKLKSETDCLKPQAASLDVDTEPMSREEENQIEEIANEIVCPPVQTSPTIVSKQCHDAGGVSFDKLIKIKSPVFIKKRSKLPWHEITGMNFFEYAKHLKDAGMSFKQAKKDCYLKVMNSKYELDHNVRRRLTYGLRKVFNFSESIKIEQHNVANFVNWANLLGKPASKYVIDCVLNGISYDEAEKKIFDEMKAKAPYLPETRLKYLAYRAKTNAKDYLNGKGN